MNDQVNVKRAPQHRPQMDQHQHGRREAGGRYEGGPNVVRAELGSRQRAQEAPLRSAQKVNLPSAEALSQKIQATQRREQQTVMAPARPAPQTPGQNVLADRKVVPAQPVAAAKRPAAAAVTPERPRQGAKRPSGTPERPLAAAERPLTAQAQGRSSAPAAPPKAAPRPAHPTAAAAQAGQKRPAAAGQHPAAPAARNERGQRAEAAAQAARSLRREAEARPEAELLQPIPWAERFWGRFWICLSGGLLGLILILLLTLLLFLYNWI